MALRAKVVKDLKALKKFCQKCRLDPFVSKGEIKLGENNVEISMGAYKNFNLSCNHRRFYRIFCCFNKFCFTVLLTDKKSGVVFWFVIN